MSTSLTSVSPLYWSFDDLKVFSSSCTLAASSLDLAAHLIEFVGQRAGPLGQLVEIVGVVVDQGGTACRKLPIAPA